LIVVVVAVVVVVVSHSSDGILCSLHPFDPISQGCDEEEKNIPRDRIRKIHTNRMTARQRWKVLGNSVKAAQFLTKAAGEHGGKHPHSTLANALLLAPSGKK